MSDHSGISWTDATWNPVTGCSPVSPGCANCYAVRMTRRLEGAAKGAGGAGGLRRCGARYVGLTVRRAGGWHFNGTVRCHDDLLTAPLQWKTPRRVFVCSMSDLFHESVPFEFINKVWSVMLACMRHTFQVLTKRPERAAAFFANRKHPWHAMDGPDKGADNIWLGTSAEDQQRYDERVPHLLACPSAVRFLSLEPLLGPISILPTDLYAEDDLTPTGEFRTHCGRRQFAMKVKRHAAPRLHWVIVGGESGPGYRRMDHEWLRRIVDDCAAAHVPVWVKQDSGPRSGMTETIPGGYLVQQWPERGA